MAIRSILQLWGSSYKHTYTHNRRDIFVVHSIGSNAMTSDLALRKPQGHLSGSRSSYSPWKQGQTLDGCPERPWKFKVKSFWEHLHLKSPQIWNMKLSGRKITCHHSVNYAVCKLLTCNWHFWGWREACCSSSPELFLTCFLPDHPTWKNGGKNFECALSVFLSTFN